MRDLVQGCRFFWETWQQRYAQVALALLLTIIQGAAAPLSAPALRWLTDAILIADVENVTRAALAAALCTIGALAAGHFAHILYCELSEVSLLALQQRLMRASNGSPELSHHESPEYSSRLHVLMREIQGIGLSSITAVLGSLSLAVAVSITGVLLATLSPWLLALPLAALPSLFLGRRAESLIIRARENAAEPARRAHHFLTLPCEPAGAKELRVGVLEQEVRDRQAAAWEIACNIVQRAGVRATAMRLLGQLVFGSAYVGATLLVSYEAVSGSGTGGDVLLTVTLAAQVNHQVAAMASTHQALQRIASTFGSLHRLEMLVAQERSGGRLPAPRRIEKGLTLEGLSFQYPGMNAVAIHDVSTHLSAGSTVAIVGENGSGKTTLVKLLCGFYQATSGHIRVDDTDVREFRPAAWRERIAAGFQDFVKFEFLAGQVVGLGDLSEMESEQAIFTALARARGADLIAHLRCGLGTPLGPSNPNGTNLSHGQWQTLALGRAMMRPQPLLLVLDEPTSALDARAEHKLFELYAANARGVGSRTGAITLLISHRFSTVRMADQILVMSRGRLIESGNHDQLMQKGGLYAELYRTQAAAYS